MTSTAIIVVSLFAWTGFSSCVNCQETYTLIMEFPLENECLPCGYGTGSELMFEKFKLKIGNETTIYDGNEYSGPPWSIKKDGVDADGKEVVSGLYIRTCRSDQATAEINQMICSGAEAAPKKCHGSPITLSVELSCLCYDF